jgi:phage shock protein PspC (stress-responsive transcriptional regulator)
MSNLPMKRDRAELARRHLYRDPESGTIAGVCAGLAHRMNMDPVWVRLAFIVTTLLWGVGLPAYLVLWVAMKELPEAKPEPGEMTPQEREIWEAVNAEMKALDLEND